MSAGSRKTCLAAEASCGGFGGGWATGTGTEAICVRVMEYDGASGGGKLLA